MYNDIIMEHFMTPQNSYYMKDADADGDYGAVDCGDMINLFIKVRDNVLTEVSYLIYGCGASIACASMTSIIVKGKTLEEALLVTEAMVDEALGGLPPLKKHCSNLGVGALRYAIDNYYHYQSLKLKTPLEDETKHNDEIK